MRLMADSGRSEQSNSGVDGHPGQIRNEMSGTTKGMSVQVGTVEGGFHIQAGRGMSKVLLIPSTVVIMAEIGIEGNDTTISDVTPLSGCSVLLATSSPWQVQRKLLNGHHVAVMYDDVASARMVSCQGCIATVVRCP